jgi:hypothetical protein
MSTSPNHRRGEGRRQDNGPHHHEICQVPGCGALATFHSFPSRAVHPDEGGMQTCDVHLAEGMSCISGQPMPEHWRVFLLK